MLPHLLQPLVHLPQRCGEFRLRLQVGFFGIRFVAAQPVERCFVRRISRSRRLLGMMNAAAHRAGFAVLQKSGE
ncbi:hypothetical protein HMSSN036_18190 [Paenibacillus macerans]|nr:hypothetical protein HMSSN036_18190 [Paenibacillus macerans]